MPESAERNLRWRCAGFRGLVRADWADDLRATDPLEWIESHRIERTADRPSTTVDRCDSPLGIVYAKQIRAVSDEAVENPTLESRVKWFTRWSRAVIAMRTSSWMNNAGVRAAPIVFAARRRTLRSILDVMFMLEVTGPKLRDALDANPEDAERHDLLDRTARAVEHLHRAGFMHGDLHLRNIVLEGDDRHICFIDNDRTRHWHMPLPWVLRKRNLAQLAYRLLRYSPEDARRLVDEYSRAAQLPEPKARALSDSVLDKALTRAGDRFDTPAAPHSTP